jgi:hypothetical protein
MKSNIGLSGAEFYVISDYKKMKHGFRRESVSQQERSKIDDMLLTPKGNF